MRCWFRFDAFKESLTLCKEYLSFPPDSKDLSIIVNLIKLIRLFDKKYSADRLNIREKNSKVMIYSLVILFGMSG